MASVINLKKDNVNTGSPVAGTGSAISFGNQSVVSVYTVVATNTITTCIDMMNGSANVIVVASISTFIVSGGGVACGAGSNSGTGGAGVAVNLSGSQAGVSYQLKLGMVNSGAAMMGTGAALIFAAQTAAALVFPKQTVVGAYTVEATNATTGCLRPMNGTANVTACPTREGVVEANSPELLEGEGWAVVVPNPVVGDRATLLIRGQMGQKIQWNLVNLQGGVVTGGDFEVSSEAHLEAIELKNATSGSYLIRVAGEDKQATVKVLKQ